MKVDGCQVEGGLGISEAAPKGIRGASPLARLFRDMAGTTLLDEPADFPGKLIPRASAGLIGISGDTDMDTLIQTAPAHRYVVGDTFHYQQLVDDKLVRDYAELTGDHNKIHVDEAFAKTPIFGRRIAHGGILFGMISKVLGDSMPGIGTIYLSQLINYHTPVFINDTVSLEVTVTALLPKNVAKIACIMKKQTGEVVVDGVATVKLPGWVIEH